VAAPASPQLQTQYTPGAVNNPILPPGLGDFNWGAFLLTWIWGIGNGVYWSFLVFVPYLGALVMPWVLAFKGNEWAWRTGRWDSVEHFQRVQKTWTRAGFIVLVVSSFILATVLVAGLMMIAWGLSQAGIKGL
jgi:hypothetical protein